MMNFLKNNPDGKNILVVEDKEHLNKVICEYGQLRKYNTFSATNGKQALEVLKDLKNLNIKVDLIITDIMMPQMDGITFLQFLRNEKEYQDTKIVIVTGSQDRREHQHAKRLGVSAFLLKPLTHEKIDQVFDCVFGEQKVA